MNNPIIYTEPRLTFSELSEYLNVNKSSIHRAYLQGRIQSFVSNNIKYVTVKEAQRIALNKIVGREKKEDKA